MDPLSDVLSLLNPQPLLSASLHAGGAWSMDFHRYEGVKFSAVLRGACWLAVEGLAQPIALEAGDCYLLTDGRPYRLGTDLGLPPADAHEVFADAVGGLARHGVEPGQEPALKLIGGRFQLDPGTASLLVASLPPVVHVSARSEQSAVVGWVLERLAGELSAPPRPGADLMAGHLAHILFVQTLRAHLAADASAHGGWLRAVADPRIGIAIGLMHEAPTRRWTLKELADAAALSRSSFALRFKRLVGVPPLDYLLRWRMQLAARALRDPERTVSSIADALGYESDSAFSNAFMRVMKVRPSRYRMAASATAG